MNKAYRLIWSRAKQAWVIVAENIAGRGAPPPLTVAALLTAASLALTAGTVHALPTSPQVISGSATIGTVGSNMTVTNSANAIINWQGFSI
ncbi:MAG: ESPR domain-containing protein, partial [Desulfuromonadales bacterium]